MCVTVNRKEIQYVRSTAYNRATLFSFCMLSRLSIFLSLLSYIYFGNIVTAGRVFIVSSYFATLNQSMVYNWPCALTVCAEGYISVQRVHEFLLMSEEKRTAIMPVDTTKRNPSKKIATAAKLAANRRNIEQQQKKLPGTFGQKPAPGIAAALAGEELALMSSSFGSRSVDERSRVKGIQLNNVTAAWVLGNTDSIGVQDLTLQVREGELAAVVGQIGSGKSTLLHVILGELEPDQGTVLVNGTLSYASQDPWLFEGTIRNNIVFVEDFDKRRYKQVVRVCALDRDFKLFPFGDSTVVGERGISLSGGQRARVNLARAIYKKADIYLLDDPLSAVDSHVGKHIFEQCIQEFLQDKICVLVTHQLQYLTHLPKVVVMNKSRLEAQGRFQDLRSQNILALLSQPEESKAQPDLEQQKESKRQRSVSICSVLTDYQDDDYDRSEQQGDGAVGWHVYKWFMGSVNSTMYMVWLGVLFVLAQVGVTGLDMFIDQW